MTVRFKLLVLAVAILSAVGCGPQRVSRGPSPQELAWERAHDLEADGQVRDALAAYRQVCDSGYDRGCLTEIRLLFDLEEQDVAVKRVFLFFERHPHSLHASSVVNEVARFFSRRGRLDDGWGLLQRLEEATKGLGAHDTVLYQEALLGREMNEPAREQAALEELVSLYGRWESQLWDDAVWRLVQIAADRGDMGAEERWLGVILKSKERSLFIGSYDSPYYDDALLMLGRLRAKRGDLDGALELFDELAGITKSRLRDDALFQAMQAAARSKATSKACDAALRLLDEAPKSRFVPEARRFVTANACR